MSDKFTIKTKDDFESLKQSESFVQINFDYQFKRIFDGGEIIFFETTDGYGTIQIKKGFGLSKPKAEIFVHEFETGLTQRLKNRESNKAAKIFNDFHKDGIDFFYVPGLIEG